MLDAFRGLTLGCTAFALPVVVWLLRDFFSGLPVSVGEAALVDDVPVVDVTSVLARTARKGLPLGGRK